MKTKVMKLESHAWRDLEIDLDSGKGSQDIRVIMDGRRINLTLVKTQDTQFRIGIRSNGETISISTAQLDIKVKDSSLYIDVESLVGK